MEKCQEKTEVWARCCGYFSPIKRFNRGKRAEYKDRKTYNVEDALAAAEDGGRI